MTKRPIDAFKGPFEALSRLYCTGSRKGIPQVMAYYLKLVGISSTGGANRLMLKPDWWDLSKVAPNTTLNWVTESTPGYTDYKVDLSLDEARALHLWFRPVLLEQVKYNQECMSSALRDTDEYSSARANDYEEYVKELRNMLEKLDVALAQNNNKYSMFELRRVEWESGY